MLTQKQVGNTDNIEAKVDDTNIFVLTLIPPFDGLKTPFWKNKVFFANNSKGNRCLFMVTFFQDFWGQIPKITLLGPQQRGFLQIQLVVIGW